MNCRSLFVRLAAPALALALLFAGAAARAEDLAPDAMVQRISSELLQTIKADPSLKSGDVAKIMTMVDTQVMPHVNFQRMTAQATGPAWRRATPEQQKRLQDEFKLLLVRTYAGALAQVRDQQVLLKPFRGSAQDTEVLVRSEIRSQGQQPVQLDYRLEKTAGEGLGWKAYDLNVLGVWLVENYRNQFAQQISANGIDGLIATLAERNKANANAARK